jgi:hypothetical protein
MVAVEGGSVWADDSDGDGPPVPGLDHLPPLREPDLVLATITRTLARVTS